MTYLDQRKPNTWAYKVADYFHLDGCLLVLMLAVLTFGLFILYSAGNQSTALIERQLVHILVAATIMLVVAQIPPIVWQRWAVWIYCFSLFFLIAALLMGHIGKGAQRWLSLGGFRFQPAEFMKFAIPLLLAWYYNKIHLPLSFKSLLISIAVILIPVILTAKQPDLGTATVLLATAASVLFFAGLSVRLILGIAGTLIAGLPLLWLVMHDYQRQRILTFLNPERNPLSTGYHIIQSKIAIGSGGLFGKGWLAGTQSQLHFLPEHTTDFIFAVCSEEFGFAGNMLLLTLYLLIVLRGLYIAVNAQDTFTRLLAGSLTITFFLSFFINIGMVTGILPVVGLPLPLVSYGGSSLVTSMASFGMLMSIKTHRKLITT
ncbi:MAG TPA: rod shape-determining protein RodA [Gammaproteobacteria bacterium]|nr:rod shape-determining protein RodA [Gammaproteobacteria bacterium]